ncbi:MAG: hypothetical protein ABI835_14630 [Chloroflexota bacterium]
MPALHEGKHMTLIICVSYLDEITSEAKRVDLGSGGELFGFEVCRTEVWGKPIMHELGLKLIPSLQYTDIYVSGKELDALEREAEVIIDNLNIVVPQQEVFDEERLAFRVNNVLKAVSKAKEVNGEVYIG